MNFDKIKKEKTKLKIIKYINSDLIHFDQEHNQKFKHQHKNMKYKPEQNTKNMNINDHKHKEHNKKN